MALPTTIAAEAGGIGYYPPFISSSGNVYVITGNASATLRAFKASDPTSSFSEVDAANNPVIAPDCYHAIQVGDTIHIAAIENDAFGNTYLDYNNFDMSTDTWGTTNEQVVDLTGMTAPQTDLLWCSIAYRAGVTTSELVIAACGVPDADMGSTYESLDFWHKNDTATTWTGPVSIHAGSSTAGSAVQPQLVLGTSNKVHCAYVVGGQAQTITDLTYSSGIGYNYAVTISTTNGVSTPAGVANTSGQANLLALSNTISYDDGGTQRFAVATRVNSATVNRILYGDEDVNNEISSLSFTTSTDTNDEPYINGETVVQSLTADTANDTLYLLWSRSSDQDIYIDSSTDGGATWTTDIEALDAVTCNRISANYYTRSGTAVIAYVYDDGGTLKYNEYSLSSTTDAAFSMAGTATLTGSGESNAATNLSSSAAATLTWAEASSATVESAFTFTAAGALTAAGAATAESDLTAAATALLTTEGVAINVTAAAWDAAAAAALTWEATSTGAANWSAAAAATLTAATASTSETAWQATAAATVTVTGEATTEADLTAAALAALTAEGTSTATADEDSNAAASITWTGEATAVSSAALDSNAAATLATIGTSTAETDWTSTAAAAVTFSGETTSETDLSAAATANLTAEGAGTAATALSVITAGAVTWNGETSLSGAWSATATAAVTFAGQPFLSADASIIAAAAAIMASSTTAEADITAAGAATLTFVGIEVSAQTAADLAASAVATFTALGGTITNATLASQATATLTMAGVDAAATTLEDFGGQRNLRKLHRQRRQLEEIEEEDIMLLTAALFTYMGQTDGN